MTPEDRTRMLDAMDRAIAANRAVRGEVLVFDQAGRVVDSVVFADREPDLLELRHRYASAACASDLVAMDQTAPDGGNGIH